jgi:hypothetical protein
VTTDRLLYQVQGLTADGQYLVTVSFPFSKSPLPAKYEDATDFPELSGEQAGDLYMKYLEKTKQTLDNAAPSGFTPSLADLDAIVQSITAQ